MNGRKIVIDDYDVRQLQALVTLDRQMRALLDGPRDRFDAKQYETMKRERDGIMAWFAHSVIKALNIEPPVIDDAAPAQVDVLDQALDIIRAAQRDLGEDLGGSVVDLLLDNLPIDRAAALELIRRIQARGDVRLHLCATEWNDLYEPGQAVVLTDDHGQEHVTRTRSVAWPLASGEVVVKVEGRTGGYLLSRIQPVEAVPV